MWFMLDRALVQSDGAEQALPALEALAQFTGELRRRLAGDGVDGIDGAAALYWRLRATLDDVPRERLGEMRAETVRLRQWLEAALRAIDDLRRLKLTLP